MGEKDRLSAKEMGQRSRPLFPNGPSQKTQKGEHSMTGQAEENLLQIFSRGLRDILGPAVKQCTELQEIRLRSGRPLLVRAGGREYAVGEGGELLPAVSEAGPESGGTGRALMVSQREIEETLECAARYSLYAFEDELRQGFLTVADTGSGWREELSPTAAG